MKLFSRRPKKTSAATIEAFWEWWGAEGARRFAAAIDQNSFDTIAEDTSARVDAMNNRLGWETGPGAASAHCLYVSSGGDPQLRPLVERWLKAAPPADETWEFASARRRTATRSRICNLRRIQRRPLEDSHQRRAERSRGRV